MKCNLYNENWPLSRRRLFHSQCDIETALAPGFSLSSRTQQRKDAARINGDLFIIIIIFYFPSTVIG